MTVSIELAALEVFGHHGATEEERRAGRTLLFDVELDVPGAALADELAHAVDYDEVADVVRAVSDGREFRLLEALAGAVLDELRERFPVERARVRVRKPGIEPGGLEAAYAAASVRWPSRP
jgi:dihydroneopterin aldolase